MANYKHTRTTMDKITVKGELSVDGTTITYIDKDAGDVTINIADCIKQFCGEEVTFVISVKDEMDMEEA